MSIIESLFYFLVALFVGSLIVKSGWRLKYLTPLCFVTAFSLMFSQFLFFAADGKYVQLFVNGQFSPNQFAIDALLASSALGGITTILLVVTVLAIRHDVF